MKERPILFKGPLVRSILAGQKTVTRRLLKMPHGFWETSATGELVPIPANCPYGKPGDRLWVRETWARVGNGDPGYLTFAATYPGCLPPELENIPAAKEIRWKPSIHMRRRDSRILLEITEVRVERLQDITEEQVLDEGIGDHRFTCDRPVESDGYPACSCGSIGYVDAFAELWNSINGPEAWDANPWVWVVEFKRVTP